MSREAFMREAIALGASSVRSTGDRPFGAVVVRADEIVGRGRNTVATSHDPTAHGEIVAIRDACARLGTHDLTGCELYTSCEPCPMCTAAIERAGIAKVYLAATMDDARAIGVAAAVHPVAREQLLAEEARAMMRDWLRG
jgi:tRNA(Arg) A34 adenosine deaminase TadA